MRAERIGKENIGEIIPFCSKCGELVDVSHERERHLSKHETLDVTCECGHVERLMVELCYFSRSKPTPQDEGRGE